ncbi:recombinase family protein [Neochlamydia sp. S13]|uniref:recombinase family protein n=1 Tax=Neochlamydia sp. S13 TaxID=1353976 RepID=UPI0005A951A3|nr:recombinase family protein [Neochlamydia sp. S13]
MFARNYVLQSRDNVKRSKKQAVKSGNWIGLAPIGYLHLSDEQGEKNVIPDSERSPFIVKLFELYATGNYSLLKLAEEAEKVGFRTKKGKRVARSQIDSILKNPFYCGMMRTKYGLTEHHYKPLISSSLYQQAQDVSAAYYKKPHKKISEPFILRGMITCAHCGCTVTPEIHKKRYIYYSCTNAKGVCKKVYIREESLVESLSQYFDHIALSNQQIADVTSYLKKIHESENLFLTESLTALRNEQGRIPKRIGQMYDDKLDRLIDEKMYLEKVRDCKARQVKIIEQMARHEQAD